MRLHTISNYRQARHTSFQSLHLLACLLSALLVLTSACAADPSTSSKFTATAEAPSGDFSSKWVGPYDPLSRACDRDILSVGESKFSWGNCKGVKTRLISASETELVFSVDSNANCGWAGWTVALTTPSVESRTVSVNAYRNLKDYQAKQSKAFCAYSKNF